jgi:hypothetical protein
MPWDGRRETLPMRTIPAGTHLFHGTDCAGDFTVPDGPAWFADTDKEAAYWAGWNVPAHDRADGERRVHAFVTLAPVTLVDIDAAQEGVADSDEAWDRLCAAVTGEDEYLDRDELAAAMAEKGLAGWWGEGETLLSRPDALLKFLSRRHVPGENGLRPEPSTYVPAAAAA